MNASKKEYTFFDLRNLIFCFSVLSILLLCIPASVYGTSPNSPQSQENKIQEAKHLEKVESLIAEKKTSSEVKTPTEDEPTSHEFNFHAEPPPSFESAFFKIILMLVVLLVIVFGALWIFRRFSNGKVLNQNNLRSVKILERRPLSPKTMLYIVDIGGKKLAICESQLEVKKICELQHLDDKPEI